MHGIAKEPFELFRYAPYIFLFFWYIIFHLFHKTVHLKIETLTTFDLVHNKSTPIIQTLFQFFLHL